MLIQCCCGQEKERDQDVEQFVCGCSRHQQYYANIQLKY